MHTAIVCAHNRHILFVLSKKKEFRFCFAFVCLVAWFNFATNVMLIYDFVTLTASIYEENGSHVYNINFFLSYQSIVIPQKLS